uniref:ISXO2-like transposase domain-containing protein n=1 Tax=Ditylenchus dipsaci TaxID=166011 RepID=A0A915D0U6_9BILA
MCSEKFPGSKSNALEHVHRVHKEGATMLMDNTSKYRSLVHLHLDEFFPIRERKVDRKKNLMVQNFC